MADLLNDCEKYFGTKNLYEVLGIEKGGRVDKIKTAYRKKSLTTHPDRAPESRKEYAKEAFQTLSKVYSILSNEESRNVYNETGVIVDENNSAMSFESFEDAANFWRTVFPRITTDQVDEFMRNYQGSVEEMADLRDYYLRFEGDLDKIFEYHIGYDEENVQLMLNEMINDKTIPEFAAFVKEPASRQQKRIKRIEKERKEAEEVQKEQAGNSSMTDLAAAILGNRERQARAWDGLLDNLEAKYRKKPKAETVTKPKGKKATKLKGKKSPVSATKKKKKKRSV